MDFSCSIATSSHCPEQPGHCCRDFSAGLSGDSSRHKIERDARCGEEQWQSLDSGEGDIVEGIKLGTHTGRLCDPGGTISVSASFRAHQKVRGITVSLIFFATRILL